MTQDKQIEAPNPEPQIQRNPHADFAIVEKTRPIFNNDTGVEFTKTPNPSWRAGDGASDEDWQSHKSITIDPYEEGRGPWLNYKLLISATVPRPIALASTVSADGKTANLAPFSFWQCASTDVSCLTPYLLDRRLILRSHPCILSRLRPGRSTTRSRTSWRRRRFVSPRRPSGLWKLPTSHRSTRPGMSLNGLFQGLPPNAVISLSRLMWPSRRIRSSVSFTPCRTFSARKIRLYGHRPWSLLRSFGSISGRTLWARTGRRLIFRN